MRHLSYLAFFFALGLGLEACGQSDESASFAQAPYDGATGNSVVDAAQPEPSLTPRADAGAPFDGATSPDVPSPPADGGDTADAADASDARVACASIASREPVTLYLSADDSNSMASPAIVRRMIRLGQRVPPAIVRTYEFLNYYNVPYEAAAPDGVRVVPQMRAGEGEGSYELQVGIASERRAPAAVRPMNITFVLDTSGSMSSDRRIERERAVIRDIAGSLRAGDIVSAVTWNTAQREMLSGYRVTGPRDPRLLALADAIDASGGTDLSGGLRAGYDLAQRNYAEDRLNRVVVISDGIANVGVTDADVIAEASHFAEREEIYLVGVGVGDGFNDTMMNTVTDRGRGAYVFIDSDAESAAMFGARFAETMDLAVRAVRLELTLPWYMRVAEFHGEAISTNPREIDPQHLAPNDAMVFHQVLQSCSGSMVNLDDHIVARATYATRARTPGVETVDMTMAELLAGEDAALLRGRAIVAWAEALKRIVPGGPNAGAILDETERAVRAARAGADPALDEILGLIAAYRAITR
jgi:Ca-activated chloride channel family protein